jgi:hypothetical protein
VKKRESQHPNWFKKEKETFLKKYAWKYVIPKFKDEASKGPFQLKCVECGCIQTYSTKNSLARSLGWEQSSIKESSSPQNFGKCTKCSRKAKRDWSTTKRKPHSKQHIERLRISNYNKLHNTNYKNVSEIPKHYDTYRKSVDERSRTQLKKYNPTEYKRWMENKYDGTDMNGLTIEHIYDVHKAFKNGWSREKVSDVSNLKVITMKQNILNYNPSATFSN